MAEQEWYEKARSVIETANVLTLATDDGGKPWAVTVLCTIESGQLVWDSLPDARHSKYVAANPNVAFNIHDGQENAVYGRAVVESTEPLDTGQTRYSSGISELWVVTNQKEDGQFIPAEELDPKEL